MSRRNDVITHPTDVHIDVDPIEHLHTLIDWAGDRDYVVYEGYGPVRIAIGTLASLRLCASGLRATWQGETDHPGISELQAALSTCPVPEWRAYGWATFELALHLAGVPTGVDPEEPLLHLTIPEIEILSVPGGARIRAYDPADAASLVATLGHATSPFPTTTPLFDRIDLQSGADDYLRAVQRAVSEIHTTGLDKVILSRPIPVPATTDLSALYRVGRSKVPAARSFLLRFSDWELAGFSPETVVEVDAQGRVRTQPLAGTRAAGLGPDHDAANRSELLSDLKEIAEHAMSVHYAYGEVRSVCEPDTVSIEEFMDVLARGSVQHLASSVVGQLRDDCTTWDAFAALFPAITASGVPKLDAYDAIRRLESTTRWMYSGAVMTAAHDGSLDAALVLRAAFLRQGHAWLRAGAGIVSASIPSRELEETCEKLMSVAPHLQQP